ncbi:MobA/MobL family protein, partial [Rhodospirillum sp. A1_3_36]|uniref:MobA/MobL family protein n=1 Tax=Rhodospirillum sp. A1_3_36 TaxID=3391666 RepID=UPI0039A42E8A
MAIYSLNHRSIGKSTHAPGTAGAHVDYITRDSAARVVLAEHMPEQRHEAHAWLDQAEASDRKNGRVCDKVMLALPRELSPEERADLVRDFARQVSQGKAPWMAAIHDKGKDAQNPHAHLVIRDKDPETGKRVACLSEKGSTERLRELWETTANAHLERAGHTVRIDRRTLAAQGIERKAQIHVGPRAKAMVERGVEPVTKTRTDHRGRKIQYLQIESLGEKTRTRVGYNAKIINLNEQKAKNEARKWDLSYWEKAVEAARKRGFSPEIERTEIHLQVAKEFVAAKKPLPHSS